MKFLHEKPSIQLLIFDLDGTLIDSKADLANSVNATLKHLGRARIEDERIFSYVGRGAPMLIKQALGAGATPWEISEGVEYFLRYYNRHMLDHTTLYPGARETLYQLASGPNSSAVRRVMAVLSNKPVWPTREIIRGLGLNQFFHVIYGGNSFEFKKPDPIGIFAILRDTGAAAATSMMIGDSDVDIVTGVNAGVWTCGVTHGFGTLNLKENPPDLVVDSLPELAEAVLNNRHADQTT